jgi:hypothetical protein
MTYHRHCERSKAIQLAARGTFLDCFVASLLAMTANSMNSLHREPA